MKLSPCPFCGKTDRLHHFPDCVECTRCEVQVRDSIWNKRPIEDDLRLCLDDAEMSGGVHAQ